VIDNNYDVGNEFKDGEAYMLAKLKNYIGDEDGKPKDAITLATQVLSFIMKEEEHERQSREHDSRTAV
jgi:hypothetical protein